MRTEFILRGLSGNWLILLGCLLLVGCAEDKDNLQTYVEQVRAEVESDIPPLPVMQPYESGEYTAEELRDPFVPTVTESPAPPSDVAQDNGIAPDAERRKEALESYPLSELQFVGTLEQERRWALIRGPDSVIHRVQTGNYMGTNHGKIQTITDTEIKLIEIVPEQGGGYSERETVISVVEVD